MYAVSFGLTHTMPQLIRFRRTPESPTYVIQHAHTPHKQTHAHTHTHTYTCMNRRGAAFGLAHTMPQLVMFRPPNRDSRITNLFFVGASTTPGEWHTIHVQLAEWTLSVAVRLEKQPQQHH
jgi:hypothetical protein